MYFIKKDFFKKENKKEKNDIAIALVVIVFFSVFVYMLMFSGKEDIIVDLEKDMKISMKDKSKASGYLKSSLDELTVVATNDLQYLLIKAEDAYKVGIDSAVVISDIKKSYLLDSEKIIKHKSIENKVIDVLEVQKEEVSDLGDSLTETKETVLKELDSDIEPLNTDNELVTNSENNIESEENELEGIDEVSSSIKESIEDELSTVKEVEIVKEEEESIVEDEEKTIIETIPETVESVQKKVITNESFDCVIVVGAFKEVTNKNAVIQRLTSLGYTHSEGVLRAGLNYVGVPVACENEQQKEKLLQELNDVFNIDSWVKKM